MRTCSASAEMLASSPLMEASMCTSFPALSSDLKAADEGCSRGMTNSPYSGDFVA